MANQDWVSRLLTGRASADKGLSVHLSERDGGSLHDKMRQAYWWITNNAVICPYYDIEFGGTAALKNTAGDEVHLPEDMSYSSFVLIPLLTLFTCRRALLVGGPGRGKTTSAILMALLSGMGREDVHRGIQRGHPQLSIADLLGAPLPSDMLKAEDLSAVKVSWRKWITQRVKIIDEYNRIPTKTQSALLSLLGEGYAEMMDQYVYTGRSSWFLTANDDQGGGTFQVIEALKDRLDVVVRAVPFNSGFVDTLLQRIESDKSPEEMLPKDIVFTPGELENAYNSILAVEVPKGVLERVAFFLGQLDFCRMASPRFEFKHKDTLKLAGQTVSAVCNEQCPLDKKVHLCTQTENGTSVRAYQTILHFAKALAFFRGHRVTELEDFRQIIPWVLHEKLTPNARSPFFEAKGNKLLLQDRVAWIRNMFDMAMARYGTHAPVRQKVVALRAELDLGLSGVDLRTTEKRLSAVTVLMNDLMTRQELSGPVYEDLIHLKSLYSRYRNYATWLKENPGGQGKQP
ncbi:MULTISPECIES: AAA family ATPase [Corallococcus]|uniref:AAA family ATPase n=1 Tax=Corallococcus TaxID=83461 RepID=UPI000EC24283|nr:MULTISPECIES: AAA family ATPase [Corallococcus]NPC73409.1 AAA family ATPase [Corallococcus exiguus]NPD29322.1 AAA family ATPase [Corallococcus exiguus]RKH97599.1 AAA family ATPase [Corallococcus sp. AB038B]